MGPLILGQAGREGMLSRAIPYDENSHAINDLRCVIAELKVAMETGSISLTPRRITPRIRRCRDSLAYLFVGSFSSRRTEFRPPERGVIFVAEVKIQEGESIESALRRFKRKVQQEDIIKDIKKHSFYLKPGDKRRAKQALARKRNRKKLRRELE